MKPLWITQQLPLRESKLTHFCKTMIQSCTLSQPHRPLVQTRYTDSGSCDNRVKAEVAAGQQEAGMAVEDKVQAALERHLAAASAGHAQELHNAQQQLQQSLDKRAQVSACWH